MPLSHFCGNNFWILKATNLNRGRWIHVFRDLPSLYKLIESYCKGIQSPTKTSKIIADKNGSLEGKGEKVLFDEKFNDSNDDSPQKFCTTQKKKLTPVK